MHVFECFDFLSFYHFHRDHTKWNFTLLQSGHVANWQSDYLQVQYHILSFWGIFFNFEVLVPFLKLYLFLKYSGYWLWNVYWNAFTYFHGNDICSNCWVSDNYINFIIIYNHLVYYFPRISKIHKNTDNIQWYMLLE